MTESSDTSDTPAKPQDYAGLRAELAALADDFTPVITELWPRLEDHKYRWELHVSSNKPDNSSNKPYRRRCSFLRFQPGKAVTGRAQLCHQSGCAAGPSPRLVADTRSPARPRSKHDTFTVLPTTS
jgi:hypothetical protein